jgi:hypothetical protein
MEHPTAHWLLPDSSALALPETVYESHQINRVATVAQCQTDFCGANGKRLRKQQLFRLKILPDRQARKLPRRIPPVENLFTSLRLKESPTTAAPVSRLKPPQPICSSAGSSRQPPVLSFSP